VDADEFPVLDSVSTPVAFALRKLSWANLKAAIASATMTLTNKTMTAPVIDKIVDGNGNDTIVINKNPAGMTNHWLFKSSNSALGGVQLSAAGSDPNISMIVYPKGTGGFFLFSDTAGVSPRLGVNGPDANIDLNLNPKGSGTVKASGATVVTTTQAQALSNKTLTNPTVNAATMAGNVTIDGHAITRVVPAPTTATSAGKVGDIAGDSGFLYVCIATNSWMRAPIATW